MDPLHPESFDHRYITLANHRKYHLCDQKPNDYVHGETPVLLLIHGFPEFWYEWRYQIGPFVHKGWRVLIPDTLGYGQTDKPSDPSLYTPLSTAGEMALLLDALYIHQPVVVVGHDWGAAAAWAFAVRYRERTKALVALSIPYVVPLPQAVTIDQVVSMNPSLLGYWRFFCSSGASAALQPNIQLLIDSLYRSNKSTVEFTTEGAVEKIIRRETQLPGPSDLMTEKERQYYIQTFEEGGIDGPLNYYRSTEYRYEQEQALSLDPKLPKEMPILFIAPTGEKFATDKQIESTKAFVPSMEVIRVDSGHFVLLERRYEISKIVGDWVEEKVKVEA